jgi:hypothetical protein
MPTRISDHTSWLPMGLILALATFCSVVTVNAQQAATRQTTASPRLIDETDPAFVRAMEAMHASTPTKIPTYFFTQEETIHNLDGSIVTNKGLEAIWEIVYAQRADGAHVRIEWPKLSPQVAIRALALPAKGLGLDIDSTNTYKTTFGTGVPEDITRRMKHTDYATCGATSRGGWSTVQEKIQGFTVIHASAKDRDGFLVERWYAPALDCMEVKSIITYTNGYTTTEPIILSDKTPDDRYFAVQDTLKELDPVAFRWAIGGNPERDFGPNWASKQMQDYERDKAAREQQKGQ